MCDWKILKENENYEINNDTCEIRNRDSKKVIKPYVNKRGYYTVTLYKNSKQKKYLLHRVIYNNLVRDLGDNEVIDHIDNNPLNNSLENLRIVTRSENSINSKRKTDFIEIDQKTQETLVILDLENEVFFYSKLKIFVRKIYKNKYRILPIYYQSQFCQKIEYMTNGKHYIINIMKYLYPELAENIDLTLIHNDGIYFNENARRFYRYYEKSGLFKELKQCYQSKKNIRIRYRFDGKIKSMNVYAYLYKNESIEVQQS